MPNIQSAVRRAKRSNVQASVNRIRRSKYKAAIKQMINYIDSGKAKDAKDFLPKFHSQLMKIAKTGVIKKKNASRNVSRISRKINSL